jgi:Flp pilus assembly protein TadD
MNGANPMIRRVFEPRDNSHRFQLLVLGMGFLCVLACASSPYSAYNRGIQFYKEGLAQEAEMAFMESVQQDAKNDDSWNQLGMIAFERKDLDLAERRFRKALELNRLNPIYPRNLALVYAERKEYETARQLLQKSLALDPADSATYLALGKVQWLEGQSELACQSFDKALEVDPSNQEAQRLRSRLQSSSK